MTLPERIRQIEVRIDGALSGLLTHASRFAFTYSGDDLALPAVGLLMPRSKLLVESTALFPVMDQNLPEGYLFQALREAFPKQSLTPMHLLALIGANAIGRLEFGFPNAPPVPPARPIDRATILNGSGPSLFPQLINAYLASGAGIAGVQPKVMVPERATVPVPNLIVKSGSSSFPHLAANEYMCLTAARLAGIAVPTFELSQDGTLLVLDRFDLVSTPAGTIRLGFEDIAALTGQQVRDTLSERKYHGSYEGVAQVLRAVGVPAKDLAAFFGHVALSVMVRNGDAHLKNFGVLYSSTADVRLAPLFDVVTTALYRYRRFDGGPELEDNTLALKMFRGKNQRSRDYPLPAELHRFGVQSCRVSRPAETLERIAQGMSEALRTLKGDPRIPADLHERMAALWERGYAYART